jgi:hypothetical protein
MDDVGPPSTALVFVTKMSEKCQFTLPSAIQVKNWQKTVCNEEKLDVIMKKVIKLLTYGIMLDSLMLM